MRPSFLTGNYTAMLSNRISHFYDLQGASMSIDTGCSSGLAALHQACQTIRSGESDVSIVGASSTILNPDLFIAMSTLGYVLAYLVASRSGRVRKTGEKEKLTNKEKE